MSKAVLLDVMYDLPSMKNVAKLWLMTMPSRRAANPDVRRSAEGRRRAALTRFARRCARCVLE